METIISAWHHSPPHVFQADTNYMLTAGTFEKSYFFGANEKLKLLERIIFDSLEEYKWSPMAWAILSNHYHLILRSPKEESSNLKNMIKKIHAKSAVEINRIDGKKGRKVWFEYRDTCLTFENSYYARLKYVMNNPVHHGVVINAEDYEFCSAGLFKWHSDKTLIRRLEPYKIDKLNIADDF